jgi:hypothetical protein
MALNLACDVSKDLFEKPTPEKGEEDRPVFDSKVEVDMLGLLNLSLEYLKSIHIRKDTASQGLSESNITRHMVEELEVDFDKDDGLFEIFREFEPWGALCFEAVFA